ncbi:jerky protein homolog-like [Octopus sinensis]|uniref:Jerky protein homolog-like n=1 Tax=Octopus sinensis TaxID=2607531 RepID=A0A6P7SVR6_9MOLL|nr:jerky protein homolog-like [Octopus sinensis]
MIAEGGYTPEQVHNVDETAFYWKCMPVRTFISQEKKSTPGYKTSKNYLTFLLGGNTVGDMQLKPLRMYLSENLFCICDITNFPQAESLHQIWKDIVTYAKDVGFEEVIGNDVFELLVIQRESLSNKELILLVTEKVENTDEILQLLAIKIIAKGFALIEEGLLAFADNGPNSELKEEFIMSSVPILSCPKGCCIIINKQLWMNSSSLKLMSMIMYYSKYGLSSS